MWPNTFYIHILWPGSQHRRYNLVLPLWTVKSLARQALPLWGGLNIITYEDLIILILMWEVLVSSVFEDSASTWLSLLNEWNEEPKWEHKLSVWNFSQKHERPPENCTIQANYCTFSTWIAIVSITVCLLMMTGHWGERMPWARCWIFKTLKAYLLSSLYPQGEISLNKFTHMRTDN